eukprot:6204924-Pleurochrysis_carterae.AAC.1
MAEPARVGASDFFHPRPTHHLQSGFLRASGRMVKPEGGRRGLPRRGVHGCIGSSHPTGSGI